MPEDAIYCPSCGCKTEAGTQPNGEARATDAPRGGYDNCPPPYIYDSYSMLSVVGFVFSFFMAVVGLITSIIAYSDAKKTFSSKSASLSKAGIIISSVVIGLYILLVVFFIFIFAVAVSTP